MADEGKADDKIVAVHVHDPAFAAITDFDQLPRHLFDQIQRFFEDYKTLENKRVEVEEFHGADHAVAVIEDALDLYRKQESQLRGWG
jgi:inorganic pyrophosphatase